jgi:hypothetical protein
VRATKNKAATSGALLVATVGMVAGINSASASTTAAEARPTTGTSAVQPADLLGQGTKTHAKLRSLNNSGVVGQADVHVDGRHLEVSVDARGLLRAMPHAMHIHFSHHSRGTCPTVRDDDNSDHRLNTTEGHPAYGSVRVSLTNRGDTGPGSALAVNRFPTAPRGEIHYERKTTTTREVARGIRSGNAAAVIHGVDYNNTDTYDFAAGKSDLDPALPTEATDPVSCGVLRQDQSLLPDLPELASPGLPNPGLPSQGQ